MVLQDLTQLLMTTESSTHRLQVNMRMQRKGLDRGQNAIFRQLVFFPIAKVPGIFDLEVVQRDLRCGRKDAAKYEDRCLQWEHLERTERSRLMSSKEATRKVLTKVVVSSGN